MKTLCFHIKAVLGSIGAILHDTRLRGCVVVLKHANITAYQEEAQLPCSPIQTQSLVCDFDGFLFHLPDYQELKLCSFGKRRGPEAMISVLMGMARHTAFLLMFVASPERGMYYCFDLVECNREIATPQREMKAPLLCCSLRRFKFFSSPWSSRCPFHIHF